MGWILSCKSIKNVTKTFRLCVVALKALCYDEDEIAQINGPGMTGNGSGYMRNKEKQHFLRTVPCIREQCR